MITKFLKSICAIALILCVGIGFSSCESDSGSDKSDTSKLIGEWEAVSIDVTYKNGNTEIITNKETIKDNLNGLENIVLTNSSLTMLSSGKNYSYQYTDNNIKITSLQMSLEVKSITENKIEIKYVSPSYTSIITYKKIENKPINKNNILGQWKAYKIVATYNNGDVYTITGQNSIKNELQGLEWVTLGENYLKVMSSGRSVPCNINNDKITVTTEVVFTLKVISLKEDEIIVKYSYPGLNYSSLISYERVK